MQSTKLRTSPRKKPIPRPGGAKKPPVLGKKSAKADKPRDKDADIEENAEEIDGLGQPGETELEKDEEGGDDEEEIEPNAPGDVEEPEAIDGKVSEDPEDLESVDGEKEEE